MLDQPNLFDPVEYAKECIREEVKKLMPKEILFATIDINKLVQITSHSVTYLEKHFINTPDVQTLECSPTTKRLWKYPDIRDCWLEFCEQNNIKSKEEQK
ncbi:hypothetical protein [Enterococcus malodoratus]|uniref:hypothetical protein n=1 Tax=Enterococcus malodoratus TaxID=71451 RepID=UPI0022E864A1|nr:hypothetical protein [Enterococcus malodoratus]